MTVRQSHRPVPGPPELQTAPELRSLPLAELTRLIRTSGTTYEREAIRRRGPAWARERAPGLKTRRPRRSRRLR